MHESRPIFIVGSPRSGTSVLTWALGQHPDLLLTEESNWLGSFAIQAAAAHSRGSARVGRSQLSALGITRGAFLSGLGDAIDRMILAGRPYLEAASLATAQHSPQQASPEFAISRDPGESKTRWVDGTPEYSLQVQALFALFPEARFVHILRDVDQVVASMLAFRDERGRPIVADAEAAYAYWMRTAQACVDAENALGPDVIRRVCHADLVADGERILRGLLDFLGEPFAPACLEPLNRRINSSFSGEAVAREYPGTRSGVIERARRLSAEWLETRQAAAADATALARWQAGFETCVVYAQELQASYETSVAHARGLEVNYATAQRMLARIRLAFNLCGVLLLANGVFALARLLRTGGARAALWLAVASAMVVVYVWLRRVGLHTIVPRILRMVPHPVRKRG